MVASQLIRKDADGSKALLIEVEEGLTEPYHDGTKIKPRCSRRSWLIAAILIAAACATVVAVGGAAYYMLRPPPPQPSPPAEPLEFVPPFLPPPKPSAQEFEPIHQVPLTLVHVPMPDSGNSTLYPGKEDIFDFLTMDDVNGVFGDDQKDFTLDEVEGGDGKDILLPVLSDDLFWGKDDDVVNEQDSKKSGGSGAESFRDRAKEQDYFDEEYDYYDRQSEEEDFYQDQSNYQKMTKERTFGKMDAYDYDYMLDDANSTGYRDEVDPQQRVDGQSRNAEGKEAPIVENDGDKELEDAVGPKGAFVLRPIDAKEANKMFNSMLGIDFETDSVEKDEYSPEDEYSSEDEYSPVASTLVEDELERSDEDFWELPDEENDDDLDIKKDYVQSDNDYFGESDELVDDGDDDEVDESFYW